MLEKIDNFFRWVFGKDRHFAEYQNTAFLALISHVNAQLQNAN